MYILEDLWFGKVAPYEEAAAQNDAYWEILHNITERETALRDVLPQDGKKLLVSYDDAHISMLDIAERKAFAKGFRLGAKIVLDILHDE